MWSTKKPEPPPVRPAFPDQQAPKPFSTTPAIAPPSGEAKPMNPVEAVHPSTTSERIAARLGASLHVKGEITGNEDLHIDGSVEGLVQLEDRKLVVGASAKVTADVIAREVVVYGNVKGNLRARDRIEIKKDGSVVGDLTTARIMIEDGAYFKGSIEIDRGADAAADHDLDKPAFSRAATRSTTTS
jgi:cytoskeletal protein CcmA (bactofilin family)